MATSRPKKDVPLATYLVLSPLNHDQIDYAAGETVELSSDQATPLLNCGVVKAVPAPAAATAAA